MDINDLLDEETNTLADAATTAQSVQPEQQGPAQIPLKLISRDTALQIRCANDQDQIDNLVSAIEEGVKLPPVDLFLSISPNGYPIYNIGDGWHRILAHQTMDKETILANVHRGDRKDALKFALGANSTHGLRRTNKDKRRAVEIATGEFPQLSDRQLAEICKVDHKTVARYRPKTEEKRIGADGKERAMPTQPAAIQRTFWDSFWDDYDSVFLRSKKTVESEDFRTHAEQEPETAASYVEKFAEEHAKEARNLRNLAEALRQGAANSAANKENHLGEVVQFGPTSPDAQAQDYETEEESDS